MVGLQVLYELQQGLPEVGATEHRHRKGQTGTEGKE
jgi:hypothetical protein